MKYRSTRGGEIAATFEGMLFAGYCNNGGLYMPDSIPVISKQQLQKWSLLRYPDLVKELLTLYVGEEISMEDLDKLVDRAYSNFSIPEIVQISHLNHGLKVVELFHGESMALKDLSLSVIGQMMNYFLSKKKKHVNILVGTSGDTGGSAIASVRGMDFIDIIVLYPKGYCNRMQELQMITVADENVHCFAVEGSSDDLDVPIKNCFADPDVVAKHNLCSINSINWMRILLQTVPYFYTYLQSANWEQKDEVLEIIVPTGAAGNIAAGCVALKMGLPISLVATVNSNDSLGRLIRNSEMSANDVTSTLASAMDIQSAYNIERLLFLATDGNTKVVENIMTAFQQKRRVEIQPDVHEKLKSFIPYVYTVPDEEIKSTIRRCWEENNGYMLCPHTATAAAYHYKRRQGVMPSKTQAILATGNPAKFPEAVEAAGLIPPFNQKYECLKNLKTRCSAMPVDQDWTRILMDKITEIDEN